MIPKLTPTIQSSFQLIPSLPPDYAGARLPGSDVVTGQNELGYFIFQRMKFESCTIEYSSFQFSKRTKLTFESDESFMQVPVSLKNQLSLQAKSIRRFELYPDQFCFLHTMKYPIESWLEPNSRYEILDIHYPKKALMDLYLLFPNLASFIKNTERGKTFRFGDPLWLNFETRNIIESMFQAPYEKELQRYYFDKKVKENLFIQLFLQGSAPEMVHSLSPDEMARASEVASMLIRNIRDSYKLPQLARKAQMNENKLQAAFRRLFGKGVFEYVRDYRLEKAWKLIEEERLQVKQVFAMVGYKSITSFITEFGKYHGCTPGKLKKRS